MGCRTVNQSDNSAHKPALPLVKTCKVVTLYSQVHGFSVYACKQYAKTRTEKKN